MALSLSALTPGGLVFVPAALMGANTSPRVAMSAAPVEPAGFVRATTGLTDPSDDTVWVTLEQEHPGLARNRWVHVNHLAPAAAPAPATLEQVEAAPAPVVAAPIIEQARRSGAMAEKRDRDRAIVAALVSSVDDGTIDDETASTLADLLSVEMPSTTFTVEVEVITRRTLIVTANNAEARHALRNGDFSFVEQSITWTGETFETTDDDLTIDREDGTDEDVNVTDVQQD